MITENKIAEIFCIIRQFGIRVHLYGAQNEAYRMMEGRKVGKVVSLQRVMRSLTVEAPQNETFTLV